MSRIEVRTGPSRYVDEPHPHLVVDGTPLEVLVDAACPELELDGLVATLIDQLVDPAERDVVWKRVLPADGRSAVVPLLVCPDDLDFSCTVVVAEVANEGSVVVWRRIGIDASPGGPDFRPADIGTGVRWLEGLGPYRFERSDYEACLAAFGRPVLKIDRFVR